MSKVQRSCEVCGTTFEVDASRLKHGRGKHCSPACQYQSIRRRIILICATCGKEFELQKSDAEYRTRIGEPPKYCSHRCAHNSPEWKTNLGQSLKVSPTAQAARARTVPVMNAVNRSDEGRQRIRESHAQQMTDPEKRARWDAGIRHRSASAVWRGAPHFQKGKAHPKYRGNKTERQVAISQYAYRQWRKAVYERDDYTCQHCHKRGGRLHAHHIQPWSTHPDLRYEISNGLTLCEICHRAIPKPR